MGYAKVSVTIPREIYEEIRDFSIRHNVKLSHVVTKALSEKLRKIREEDLIDKINKVYEDSEVATEHYRIAESIADNTNVEELPW